VKKNRSRRFFELEGENSSAMLSSWKTVVQNASGSKKVISCTVTEKGEGRNTHFVDSSWKAGNILVIDDIFT
jgi:hypothetical protein